MEREEKPSLNQALERANPKLKSDNINIIVIIIVVIIIVVIIIVAIVVVIAIVVMVTIMIRFLSDCFQYVAAERPSTTFVLRGLTQILAEVHHQHHHHVVMTTTTNDDDDDDDD